MQDIEIYKLYKNVSLDEFGERFGSIQRYAFRLELLQDFSVDDEKELLNQFSVDPANFPSDMNAGWVGLIKETNDRGGIFQRVRYITRPLTEYTKFEVQWGYRANIAGGEQISVIEGERLPSFETNVPILKDFWLFDDQEGFLMEYDLIGRFIGVRKIPDNYLDQYLELKKEVLEKGRKLTTQDCVDYS